MNRQAAVDELNAGIKREGSGVAQCSGRTESNKPMQPTGWSLIFIRQLECLIQLSPGRLIASVRRYALIPRQIHMWRTVATSAVSVIVIIFLPITLFGLILPIDDYQAQGIIGPVDCDGPLAVMLFVGPSLAVYAAGAVYYAVLLKGQRRSMLVILCVVMVVAAGAKAWAVYREQIRPEHQRACGEGR
jgi:hypothetical protein